MDDMDSMDGMDAGPRSTRLSIVSIPSLLVHWTGRVIRIVVPLALILLAANLSIFIPIGHFEAIITLQVTALLSAVALYLSLPELDADIATLSDRIFLFDYMLVSTMIGISILRINRLVASQPWIRNALGLVHIVLIPALVAVMALYLYRVSLAEGG
jgi:hypothetical protein